MTPKINGLGQLLGKLKHDFETASGPLMTELETLGPDGLSAIKKVTQHVASAKAFVKELADFNKSMEEGSNGSPTLRDSRESSETSEKPAVEAQSETAATAIAAGTDGEPGKSWAGEQAKPA